MYKCAIVGCGRRAVAHADAYRFVKRGRLVAICHPRSDRLEEFGERFAVAARYTDVSDLLENEKPDLVHIVTRPNVRVELLRVMSEHKVPAVIIEKPIATQGEDYSELRELASTTSTKICVNHQLHFHPRALELQEAVKSGRIGEVRFAEASSRSNPANQGTHILELLSAFTGAARPTSVFGQVAGAKTLEGYRDHSAPDECVASIGYENGVRAQIVCGSSAPKLMDAAEHMHKRISVYGTKGMAQWTMHGWELSLADGTTQSGTHDYWEQDVLGQAGLTEAAFDWLEDDGKAHPTNLDASLTQMNVILGLYMSALRHAPISLPVEPEPRLIDALRSRLARQ